MESEYVMVPARTAAAPVHSAGVPVERWTRSTDTSRLSALRTTSTTRRLAAADGGIALAATDPLLDAMAFSRGRFTVEVPGTTALVLPSHAEVGRVIEDCRG